MASAMRFNDCTVFWSHKWVCKEGTVGRRGRTRSGLSASIGIGELVEIPLRDYILWQPTDHELWVEWSKSRRSPSRLDHIALESLRSNILESSHEIRPIEMIAPSSSCGIHRLFVPRFEGLNNAKSRGWRRSVEWGDIIIALESLRSNIWRAAMKSALSK